MIYEEYGRTAEFQTILELPEALRGEFEVEIDAHPGSGTVQAGQVNRAFQVTAGCVLKTVIPSEDDLAGSLTWVLRQVAERRLVTAGVSDSMTVALLDHEPGLGDSWDAYLALAPEMVKRDLLNGGRGS